MALTGTRKGDQTQKKGTPRGVFFFAFPYTPTLISLYVAFFGTAVYTSFHPIRQKQDEKKYTAPGDAITNITEAAFFPRYPPELQVAVCIISRLFISVNTKFYLQKPAKACKNGKKRETKN